MQGNKIERTIDLNKRTMFMIGAVSAALLTSAGAVDAKPTSHSVYVDGKQVNCAAYAINRNNYFKLRDLAAMVNGTEKQFEVTWNENQKAISLLSNKPYTIVGGEMGAVPAGAKDAKVTSSVIYKDGKKENYAAYNINDNNYFKLRDIAEAFNIGIKWDATTQRVDVLTNVGYGEENTGTTSPEEPAKPTTPTTPDSSSNSSNKDEDYQVISDYRQAGDEGIRSVNLGGTVSGPMYIFYPSYDHYSAQYQNLLDTCGEDIITKTIYYNTYCSQTGEDGTLSGFPMEVNVVDDRLKENTWFLAKTIYVDAGEGSFELKMPKSIYEKILSGDRNVLMVSGSAIENGGMRTVINGNTYQLNGNPVVASDVRDSKPTRVRFSMSYKKTGK